MIKLYAQKVAYCCVHLLVIVHNLWRLLQVQCSRALSFIAQHLSWLGSSLRQRAGASTLGTTPQKPSVLGVVLTEDFDGKPHMQGIARLLTWARLHHFKLVFLYDSTGALDDQHLTLEQQVSWIDPHQHIVLWQGWHHPPHFDLFPTHTTPNMPSNRMGVAILSASDSEWPLTKGGSPGDIALDLKRSRTPGSNSSSRGVLEQLNGEIPTTGGGGGKISPASSFGDKLAEAVYAPKRLKQRLVAAAGPLAGFEPDLVLVFGEAFTLAGYPSWAVRVSEVYHVGSLASVTHSKLEAVLRKFKKTRQRFGK